MQPRAPRVNFISANALNIEIVEDACNDVMAFIRFFSNSCTQKKKNHTRKERAYLGRWNGCYSRYKYAIVSKRKRKISNNCRQNHML